MTTAQPDRAQVEPHPFSAAIAARDVDALVASLAPDVVLHSTVARVPFEGPELLRDLYSGLFESFEELRVVDEFSNGDTHAFFWEGTIDGRPVTGADRLRLDAQGRVREITVVARPLHGIAGFLTGIGFRLARRRRGPVVAMLLRLSTLPLAPLFTALDPVTRWVTSGSRRAGSGRS